MSDRTVSMIPTPVKIGSGTANVLNMGRCRFDGDGWKKLTHEEWLAEGRRRFGEYECWKFVCPSCGHIQCVEDFRQFKDKGAQPDTAAQSCIGRFTGATGAFNRDKHTPCNYTARGLFCLCTTVVTLPDGEQLGSGSL